MITNICRFYHKKRKPGCGSFSPLLGVLTASLVAASPATAGMIINGYEWEYAYYGSDIPIAGNANWSVFKGSTTPYPAHVGTNLVITTNAALNQQAYYTSTQWNPSAATGVASAEVRMRLDSVMSDSANNATIAFSIASASGGTAFYLGAAGLYLFPGSGAPLVSDFDPTEFHTYRVILNTQAATFSLEIDGVRKLTDHVLSTVFNSNILRIGDLSSTVGGGVSYEYIAWDNMAAPIPEPAVALLLPAALGVVALRRRSRQ